MKEALFQLDAEGDIGLQVQIRRKAVAAILARALVPGERLPSSRRLAEHLKVSRNTVMLAYQALVDDGYLEPHPRSGYIVAGDAPVLSNATAPPLAEGADRITWYNRFANPVQPLRTVSKPLNWREYKYPFVYGQADFGLFSHSEWRECARQALGVRDFSLLAGDFGIHDDPLLVNYIASNSLPQRGIPADPKTVLVTLGAQNAIYLLTSLLADHTTKVVLEEPCYPEMRGIVTRRTNHVASLAVDQHGIVPDEQVLARCDLLFVTPSHQSPTNATLSIERRRKLLELAERHDFLIIEDDYEFELNFLTTASPALKSMDETGRVIYVGSFSKSLFPGLRLGYMNAAAPVIEQARRLRHLMLRHPPGHTQRTAAYFMALGHYDAQIRRLRRALAIRRKIMQRALDRHGLKNTAAQFGGTSFWIEGPPELDSGELAKELCGESVLIEAGEPFFPAAACRKNFFRAAYSSIDEERIDQGVALIADRIHDPIPLP